MKVLFPTILIFTVDDSRLLRMKLKMALFEPGLQHLLHSQGFLFGTTVHHSIIRIAAEWNLWIISPHPFVKHIVHEEIGKQRTDDSSHTIDNFEFEQTVRYTRVWNKK
jgi:hypothetical protein